MSDDYICYVPKKFTSAHLQIIGTADEILKEYAEQGFLLTLRQLYYQFVARDLMPNRQTEYQRLGGIISEARLAGLIPWSAIEDRGRSLRGVNSWDSPAQFLNEKQHEFALDLWAGQFFRPEVWVEKQALEGVIGGICSQLRVDFFSTKGYNSQSEQWRAGRRFARYIEKGQRPIVFHLGDHDPSGMDMTRDNQERLSLFAGVEVQVVRLALNTDQVEQYTPPPNPVKFTDSRSEGYVQQHGYSSWELDALSPRVISDLIENAIKAYRDEDIWDEAVEEEVNNKRVMEQMIAQLGGKK